MRENKVERTIYSVFFAIISFWCLLALSVPLLAKLGLNSYSQVLGSLLSFGCHQEPEKSFVLFGESFGLCVRCTGIYFSMLLATIIYPLIRKRDYSVLWIFLFIAPLSLDVITEKYLFFRVSNNEIRLITGVLFGLVLPYFIISGATVVINGLSINKIKKGIDYAKSLQGSWL